MLLITSPQDANVIFVHVVTTIPLLLTWNTIMQSCLAVCVLLTTSIIIRNILKHMYVCMYVCVRGGPLNLAPAPRPSMIYCATPLD
jgi:hypothetical protein